MSDNLAARAANWVPPWQRPAEGEPDAASEGEASSEASAEAGPPPGQWDRLAGAKWQTMRPGESADADSPDSSDEDSSDPQLSDCVSEESEEPDESGDEPHGVALSGDELSPGDAGDSVGLSGDEPHEVALSGDELSPGDAGDAVGLSGDEPHGVALFGDDAAGDGSALSGDEPYEVALSRDDVAGDGSALSGDEPLSGDAGDAVGLSGDELRGLAVFGDDAAGDGSALSGDRPHGVALSGDDAAGDGSALSGDRPRGVALSGDGRDAVGVSGDERVGAASSGDDLGGGESALPGDRDDLGAVELLSGEDGFEGAFGQGQLFVPAQRVPEEKQLLNEADLVPALEAILMVVDEPVGEIVLAQVLDVPAEQVANALLELSARYTLEGKGFDLRRAAGGWRFYTRAEYSAYVEKFVLDGQQLRLTQASLETLAVVAYKQPVTRSRISAIRGVNCDGVVRTLITRGLIEECGTEPESGAHLYKTTNLFLEKLGLDSVAQLPPLAPFLPDNLDEVAANE